MICFDRKLTTGMNKSSAGGEAEEAEVPMIAISTTQAEIKPPSEGDSESDSEGEVKKSQRKSRRLTLCDSSDDEDRLKLLKEDDFEGSSQEEAAAPQ